MCTHGNPRSPAGRHGEQFYRLRNAIMNHPPRLDARAARASTRARMTEATPAPVPGSDAELQGPCCGGTGRSPAPVRTRFECSTCGGIGLVTGEPCSACDGRGYGLPCWALRQPFRLRGGDCVLCEPPRRAPSPCHVTASLD